MQGGGLILRSTPSRRLEIKKLGQPQQRVAIDRRLDQRNGRRRIPLHQTSIQECRVSFCSAAGYTRCPSIRQPRRTLRPLAQRVDDRGKESVKNLRSVQREACVLLKTHKPLPSLWDSSHKDGYATRAIMRRWRSRRRFLW